MNIKHKVSAVVVLVLATTASSIASSSQDNEDEDNSFLRGSPKKGNLGNVFGSGGMKPKPADTPLKDRLEHRQKVLDHWTPDRIQEAKPRHMSVGSRPVGRPVGKFDHGHDRRNLLDPVADDPWESGGNILRSAGRLLFVMEGSYFICSATTILDKTYATPDRSVLITASHCVYDDVNKEFASNFLFIPNQDDDGTDTTDLNCTNDPFGCWTPSFAVVDVEWASRSWPENIPSDYAYLVVNNRDNREEGGPVGALDRVVRGMEVSFTAPTLDVPLHALGYSGKDDPGFQYCVQDIEEARPGFGGFQLSGCGLQGGSSGGPWVNGLDSKGRGGVIVAVNSYGPSSGPDYMGGPRLYDNSAQCLYEFAQTIDETEAAGNGIVITYNPSDCSTSSYVSGDDYNGN